MGRRDAFNRMRAGLPAQIVEAEAAPDVSRLFRPEGCSFAVAGRPAAVRRVGDEGEYNASVIRWGHGWVGAFRVGSWPSEIVLRRFDVSFELLSESVLPVKAPWCEGGLEDPRLWVFGARLFVSFTGLRSIEGAWFGRVCVAELDVHLGVVWSNPCEFLQANEWEKNWAFFAGPGDGLRAVYDYYPHRVHAVDLAGGQPSLGAGVESLIRWPAAWCGRVRGGAAPVLVGDEWYCFAHTTGVRGDAWQYECVLYTFSAKPPFAVQRVCVVPFAVSILLVNGKFVVYPCGACFDGSSWHVSFGLHDKESWVMTIGVAEIERLLVKVPRVKTLKDWGGPGGGAAAELLDVAVSVESAVGTLWTREPGLDVSMALEVAERDSYGLRALSRFFRPSYAWDLGAAVGQVSLFMRRLWPGLRLLAVEADAGRAWTARRNLGDEVVVDAMVGNGFPVWKDLAASGYPDLVVMDCEGGEMGFVWQGEERNLLQHLGVVCGEWHLWSGRAAIAAGLDDSHVVFFTDPLPGSGPWHYFRAVPRRLLDGSSVGVALAAWVEGR